MGRIAGPLPEVSGIHPLGYLQHKDDIRNNLNKADDSLDLMTQMEPGEQLTNDIIELVLKHLAERVPNGATEDDMEPVFRGMCCALASVAYHYSDPVSARNLLIGLAEQLEDPATREWALTNGTAFN